MHRKWLITGASGQLGGYVLRALAHHHPDDSVCALAGAGDTLPGAHHVERVDLADTTRLAVVLSEQRPTHVLHLAAMTAVNACFNDPARAAALNINATTLITYVADEIGARLVHCSTDMVFDGYAAPYRESDPVAPLSVYGLTKANAEAAARESESVAIVRLPLMYGLPLTDRATTFANQLAALRAGDELKLFADEFRTPVWLADAADALLAVAESDFTGTLHVAGPERLSRHTLISRCAEALGISNARLTPISWREIEFPEPRPADLSLVGERFVDLFPAAAPQPVRPAVFESV